MTTAVVAADENDPCVTAAMTVADMTTAADVAVDEDDEDDQCVTAAITAAVMTTAAVAADEEDLWVPPLAKQAETIVGPLELFVKKIPGARVLRVAADEDKGELLAKLIALAQNNMSIYLTEPEDADELSRVGAEIAASSVVSIEIGTALLGFAAYRIHEPEHGGVADKKFTYLFELHKDLSDPRTGGLGDLLEAEVTLQAEGVSESMLLTVLRKNDPARRFYNKHGWFRLPFQQEPQTQIRL